MNQLLYLWGSSLIFGKSLIREDGVILLPEQAIREYDITVEGAG